MRDAACELADRLHLLRLAQRLFCGCPLVHLGMEALRPAQDGEQREEEQDRRWNSKDQVRSQLTDPFVANRRDRYSGLDIKRHIGEATGGKAPGDAINGRICRVQAAFRMLGNRPSKARVVVQPVGSIRRRDRISSEDVAVVADEPVLQTGRVSHRRIKPKEACGRNRDRDDIVERSVSANGAAYGEGGGRVDDRLINLPVVVGPFALLMRADEIAVGKIQRWRRLSGRAYEGIASGVENADRLGDPDVRHQRVEALVEARLICQYVGGGALVDEAGRVIECMPDEEEVLLRFLLLDIERPQQTFGGQLLGVSIGNP